MIIDYKRLRHEHFVFDAWFKSSQKLNQWKWMKKSRSLEVIQLYSNLIRNMMENDVVKLLVDDDDENLFLGFIAYEPKTKVLDYVYLIFAMRGIGLADKLIKDVLGDGDLTCSHSNGRLPKNFKFNPFTLTERNYK